jgi:uncharacterized protein (DUF1697 family)
MITYIALLRAINVGGHAKVGMAELRDLIATLGYKDVRSLLQTGNLVFHGDARKATDLERLLEVEAERRLGLATDVMVRTAQEWAAVLARNPFPAEAKRDPGHLVVQFAKEAPKAKAVDDLRAAISGREAVQADGKHLYVVYPDGLGRSKLTTKLIEGKLGTRVTGRNWNTVLKLAELAREA